MPNWCNNTLTVTGPNHELQRFYNLNRGPDTELSLDALVPEPESVDWHSWRMSNWGTKWDVSASLSDRWPPEPDRAGGLVYSFDSAWSPPVKWLENIRPLFPDLEFELEYFEGGEGYTGSAISAGPEDVIDDYRRTTSEDNHNQGYHDGDPQDDCDECNEDDFAQFHESHATRTNIESYILEQCVICRHLAGREHPATVCELCEETVPPTTQQRNPEPDRKRQAFRWMQYAWSIDKAEELIAKRRKKIPPEMVDVDYLYGNIRWHPTVFGVSIDKDYALTKADLSRPLIMGLIKSEGQWFNILIDGHHRLYRAKHEGIKKLPAHLLTKAENHKASMGMIRPPIRNY